MNILVIYGTTEGHTRKVCERVAERIAEKKHIATLYDSTSLPQTLAIQSFDAVIIAASVHQGRHQSSIVHFIKKNLELLQNTFTAFVSISLASALEKDQHEAQEYVDKLLKETGWRPTRTELAAGALVYTQYDFFKRQIMKFIVRKEGGPTDASRDYEYTDWNALDRFVDSFLENAGGQKSSGVASKSETHA